MIAILVAATAAPSVWALEAQGSAGTNDALQTDPNAVHAGDTAGVAPAGGSGEDGEDSVLLNFVNADIKEIIHTISEITGENFILASGISARITVQTSTPIPRDEVFGIFESILEVNGLAAVRTGSYYKIVSSPAARRRGVEFRQDTAPETIPPGDRVITQIVPVEFISSGDLVPILQPMLSQAGSIHNHAKANTLIITDVASNIKKALGIINVLDADAFERMKVVLVPVVNVDVATLHKELTDILNSLGIGGDARQLSVVPIDRLNSLIILSSNTKLLESVKGWAQRLDRALHPDDASMAGDTVVHVYYVKNDSASKIKALLDKIFLAGGKTVPGRPLPKGVPQGVQAVRPRDGISIFLYEPFNALIIQASQRDYRTIMKVIEELDRSPKQALIDTLIVEVKLDESTKYGIQWSLLTGNFNLQQNTGIFSDTVNTPGAPVSTPAGKSTPSGLSVFVSDSSRFFGVLQALATEGKVNVLSNPHIIVKNYEKASINIGSDEPIATQSTQTAVTGTTGLIQTIEYRKTGIILTVSPQITEGGMVALNIRQEISDKSTDRTVGAGTFPSFSKREVETSVVARDGATIVIGGLIQEKKERSSSGIPILKDIPILGHLFRFKTDTVGKTELVILLTPKIIATPEEAASATGELRDKLKGLKKLLKRGDAAASGSDRQDPAPDL